MNLLIRKAKKRDKAAFQELMEQQTRAMYKVVKAILKNDEDVADAMQDMVLACWEKINTLQKDKYFQTWLMRILINNCNAIWRQRARTIAGGEVPEAAFPEDGYANVLEKCMGGSGSGGTGGWCGQRWRSGVYTVEQIAGGGNADNA